MRKAIRYVIFIGGAIIFANVFAWGTVGREQALLLGSDSNIAPVLPGQTVTVYLFTGRTEREGVAQFADFASTTVERLVHELQKSGRIAILDPRPFPLIDDSEAEREWINGSEANTFAYDVSIERPFPLGAEVTRLIWAPGFALYESALYVWFFGWHHVKDTGSGMS